MARIYRSVPFHRVDPKPSFPRLEQDVQAWWRELDVVHKALASGDPSRPFVFFEGPPTANGRPGVRHVEARSIKDAILRYRRMRGQKILGAHAGWDTHGLPVELEVQRELVLRGKPDIERFGDLGHRSNRDLTQLDLYRPYADALTWSCLTAPRFET